MMFRVIGFVTNELLFSGTRPDCNKFILDLTNYSRRGFIENMGMTEPLMIKEFSNVKVR